MPHQCTDCGRSFDDGSKQMLSGCPECGGNKFQYQPDSESAGETTAPDTEEPPEPPEPPVDSSVARTVGNAATAVRDFVGSGSSPDAGPEPGSGDDTGTAPDTPSPEATPESPADAATAETATSGVAQEDAAQQSARSDIVSKDDLPPAPDSSATSRPTPVLDDDSESPETAQERDQDRPDLSELREELNDQFESIKVLSPGHYELNLMELYDREEYIIALQEDGKYTIQVPERWEDS